MSGYVQGRLVNSLPPPPPHLFPDVRILKTLGGVFLDLRIVKEYEWIFRICGFYRVYG
jgi:hypothetical protein